MRPHSIREVSKSCLSIEFPRVVTLGDQYGLELVHHYRRVILASVRPSPGHCCDRA